MKLSWGISNQNYLEKWKKKLRDVNIVSSDNKIMGILVFLKISFT